VYTGEEKGGNMGAKVTDLQGWLHAIGGVIVLAAIMAILLSEL